MTYPVVSVPPVLRVEYIQALKAAQREGNPSDEKSNALIAECVREAQRDYCHMFRIQTPKRDLEAR